MTEDTKSGTEIENNNTLIRENLVETAVNFLLNPNVINKPEHTKVAFLKNKGLTDPEISAAFHKAQSNGGVSSVQQQNYVQNRFTPPPPPSQPYYPKQYSFWSRLSSISSSLIVIAVALYGLHRFYKLYIEPWLFGTKPKGDEMKELVTELSHSVMQLKNSISTLEFTVQSQKEQIDRIFLAEGSPYLPIPMAVAELKTEIGNVKSLLINRHQFPAVPKVATSPSIPQWQLSGSEGKDAEPRSEDEMTEKSLSPESVSPDKETDEAGLEAKQIRDRIEPFLRYSPGVFKVIENGGGGEHEDSLPQSTSVVVESEEKSIPFETGN